ncbi:MAG TPA: 5-dehydro-2-deoxygluconokinase [Burkholderiaceae bacterium]|nr:5-dehydro-2-deoxygluconokinase [Burkholderiaceae bacterium]
MTTARAFDVICLGRAAVDLYGEQVGVRLEDVTSFARYLGGSPANTAVGCARLGLRAAMLTRVGAEQNGNFVRETLAREGVDVSAVGTDPQRLTALVFLSIRSREEFPLLFYRDRCADMALSADDVDPAFIASAKALLVSGTHLSQPEPYAACRAAINAARAAGTRVVLDIDYRPVLWGLLPLDDGATRYVRSRAVTQMLQTIVGDCDLVVGTEEEFRIAGGVDDVVNAVNALRLFTRATLVVKRGEAGCTIYAPGVAPIEAPGFPIEVFNVLGAGDAFMAGFLSGWLRIASLEECGRRANACGALVVSRHGCAPAIPTALELEHYLSHGSAYRRLREDPQLNRLHRVTTRAPAPAWIAALAFDHRAQFEALALETARNGTPVFGDAEAARIDRRSASSRAAFDRIAHFKRLIAAAAQMPLDSSAHDEHAAVARGLIVDDRYAADLMPALDADWIARPVEEPGSRPLRFDGTTGDGARPLAALLREWPRRHVAKCLVAYDPDDEPALRTAQLERLQELAACCDETQREFLLEVIAPLRDGDARDADQVIVRAVTQITAAGVRPDWWKLAAPASRMGWARLATAIEEADPYCRGVLVLGLDAPLEELAARLAAAAAVPLCRGFAVGRTIFGEAARAWFAGELDDAAAVATIRERYLTLVRAFAAARADVTPYEHRPVLARNVSP